MALCATGKFDDAIEEHKKALEIVPDKLQAQKNLKVALEKKRIVDKEGEHNTKNERSDNRVANAHYNAGFDFLIKGNINKAIDEYNDMIKMNPDNIWANYRLGEIYSDLLSYEKAIEQYKKFINTKKEMRMYIIAVLLTQT